MEIFKDKAKEPEQDLYGIHGRVDDREMRIGIFTKPQSEEISSKSKLAQFKHRYKRFPTLGMKVNVPKGTCLETQEGFLVSECALLNVGDFCVGV